MLGIPTRQLRGFTLIELLISMTIFLVVLTVVIQFYVQLADVKRGLEGKQLLIESSYFMLEKMQIQMKNYTIDYEEYFNRRSLGCDTDLTNTQASDFTRNVGSGRNNGYCDKFTAYGNSSFVAVPTTNHALYNCSSVLTSVETVPDYIQNSPINLFTNRNGCYEDINTINKQSAYGQYDKNFLDVRGDVDFVTGSLGDDDDIYLGFGPTGIGQATGVQELYLISLDKTRRLFMRRALLSSGDYNGDSIIGDQDSEKLYTLQMLRLRGFDIGNDHTIGSADNDGLYDGQIDTWVCDAELGFVCQGNSLGGFYGQYNLADDEDDGWIRMFTNSVTVSDWNLEVYPSKDPALAWQEDTMQISPYVTLSFQTKLYGSGWYRILGEQSIDAYSVSLQTTFAIDSFYGK